jgi:uncharacterized damage-inducible protein DinB
MTPAYFATLARHSAWANRRLYDSCETLSAMEYLRERPSSYGSLHATLNYVLATDRAWIARLEGRTPPPFAENQILYADLLALKIARLAEDEHLKNLVDGLSAARMASSMHYIDQHGDRVVTSTRLVLAHLFDFQSRCRGETLALLAQAGVPTPPVDLLVFLRDAGTAASGPPP